MKINSGSRNDLFLFGYYKIKNPKNLEHLTLPYYESRSKEM